jgi:hypothetical protein
VCDSNAERAWVVIAPGPVETNELEAILVRPWIRDLLVHIQASAQPDEHGLNRAPIHLYFWDSAQRSCFVSLAQRQRQNVLGIEAVVALLEQKASFDSQPWSVLADEIEHQRCLPMLCQNLQAVSRWLGFTWDSEIASVFRARQFDALGQIEHSERNHLVPGRSRFRSDIPSEYFHVAWRAQSGLGLPDESGWKPYSRASVPLLTTYIRQRLLAIAHVAGSLRTNKQLHKTSFDLSVLRRMKLRGNSPIDVIREFAIVERHSEFSEWLRNRSWIPARRVQMGESLLVRFLDSDQDPDVRKKLREARDREHLALGISQDERIRRRRELDWTLKDLTLVGRIDNEIVKLDLEQILRDSGIRTSDRVIISPAWSRPDGSQTSPRAILYGQRAEIESISLSGIVCIKPVDTFGRPGGYVFTSFLKSVPRDGDILVIDPAPDSIAGHRQMEVINEIAAGRSHGGYSTLFETRSSLDRDLRAQTEQARFAEGLSRFGDIDAGASRYEESKLRYIRGGSDAVTLVQGPPGTGKSTTTGFAILARLQAALASEADLTVALACKTHVATDVLLNAVRRAQRRLAEIQSQSPVFFASWFDERLLDVPLYRYMPRDESALSPEIVTLAGGSNESNLNGVRSQPHAVIAGTTNGIGRIANHAWKDDDPPWDALFLDEASQMSVPEYLVASLGLKSTGELVVVGDHRQMPPIIHQDWESDEASRDDPWAIYRSLFDVIREHVSVRSDIQFTESFRIHRNVAEYLRAHIYQADDLALFSSRSDIFVHTVQDDLISAIFSAQSPVVLVVHDEHSSQQRNEFERDLVTRLVTALDMSEPRPTIGIVVPHRAQRNELRSALRRHSAVPDIELSVDTVERFQGSERDLIVVSATESDPAYIRTTARFLLDPRRLTVAISRAERKLVIVASRSIFEFVPSDLEALSEHRIWRDLYAELCTIVAWQGHVKGHPVEVRLISGSNES